MAEMARTHTKDPARPQGDRAPQADGPEARGPHPGRILQRAARDPGSLTARDALSLQGSIGNRATNRLLRQAAPRSPAPIQRKEGAGGLPPALQTGIESLSGISMDDVSVHYNSDKPREVRAHAYTQGSEIHVGPGQESTLPHEAWHVVQQKQGRVKPSIQMKGIDINLDSDLEREADVMGARADSLSSIASRLPSAAESARSGALLGQTVQRKPVRQFGCGSVTEIEKTSEKNLKDETGLTSSDDEILEDFAERSLIDSINVADDFQKSGLNKTVTYHKQNFQRWKVTSSDVWLYTAKPKWVWKKMQKNQLNGLDPAHGGKPDDKLSDVSGWMSRGHVYFTLNPKQSAMYASRKWDIGKWVMLRFRLDEGATFWQDPEWPQGFRTKQFIPAEGVEAVPWEDSAFESGAEQAFKDARDLEKQQAETKRRKRAAREQEQEQQPGPKEVELALAEPEPMPPQSQIIEEEMDDMNPT